MIEEDNYQEKKKSKKNTEVKRDESKFIRSKFNEF